MYTYTRNFFLFAIIQVYNLLYFVVKIIAYLIRLKFVESKQSSIFVHVKQ